MRVRATCEGPIACDKCLWSMGMSGKEIVVWQVMVGKCVKMRKYEFGIGPSIINSGSDPVGLLHLAQVEA